jgi:uncharacterized membrane protein
MAFTRKANRHDHGKFEALVKETLSEKVTELKIAKAVEDQQEAARKVKAEADAKAVSSRRTWGF